PAVTGRVLTAEAMPQPIPGVTVTLGSAFVLSDAGGNFVLLAPPAGQNMLFVDGRTASTPGAQFPIVEVNVTVSASGPTRVPINFPNVTEAAPGTKADLYFFDLAIGGWNTWGTGTVSADGKQVVSDPGFGLPRLAWHWWDIIRAGLPKLWGFRKGGDPVDLATG